VTCTDARAEHSDAVTRPARTAYATAADVQASGCAPQGKTRLLRHAQSLLEHRPGSVEVRRAPASPEDRQSVAAHLGHGRRGRQRVFGPPPGAVEIAVGQSGLGRQYLPARLCCRVGGARQE
jgi:hypothetical protein